MLGKHVYDPAFLYSSSELRKILPNSYNILFDNCLDIPCGNGRNIFLLASYFKKVVGVDINQEYLNNINDSYTNYSLSKQSISTRKIDLEINLPDDVQNFDFISIIHYYNYSLIAKIINAMKKGAFSYIETQSCAGENYKELPTEEEVTHLLKDMEVVLYKKNVCRSSDAQIKHISFKALLRKPNDRKKHNS